VLGSGRDLSSGGSQGSIAPKGVAVVLGVMMSYCSADAKHSMFVDLGFGDGRMMIYAHAAGFGYIRGTEIGGQLPVLYERIEQWLKCVDSETDHDIKLYRHERSITRPAGPSQLCHVAVWHFHQGWTSEHIERVRRWLARFRVTVYVGVSPASDESTIGGFTHVCSVTVKMTGQRGQSRARVFVRNDLAKHRA
jgi:hypothetical protein